MKTLYGWTLALFLAARGVLAGGISVSGSCSGPGTNFLVGEALTFNFEEPAAAGAELIASYPPCTALELKADVTRGKPPLTHRWRLPSGAVLEGNPALLDTRVLPPGPHTLVYTVSNAWGQASANVVVAVEQLGFLGSPAWHAVGGNTVTFDAQVLGATELRWSWGDGTTTGWVTPCEGLRPRKTYAAPGRYSVVVEARNCRDAAVSRSFEVIASAEPVPQVLSFQARGCLFGIFCQFPAGVPVVFDQVFGGAHPAAYAYDWNGDGSLDEVSAAPVSAHTYFVPGFYTPAAFVLYAGGQHSLLHQWPVVIEALSGRAPAAPSSLAAVIKGVMVSGWSGESTGVVELSWTESSADEAGFFVWASADGAAARLLETVGPVTSFGSATVFLPVGATYRLHTTAYNSGGQSGPSPHAAVDLVRWAEGRMPRAGEHDHVPSFGPPEVVVAGREAHLEEHPLLGHALSPGGACADREEAGGDDMADATGAEVDAHPEALLLVREEVEVSVAALHYKE